tara:strand:+ start:117 stop:764 length:648 start_codon:yes stop_codon:yes gene_type:complete
MKKTILAISVLTSLTFADEYRLKQMVGYDVNPKETVEIGDHEVFGLSLSRTVNNCAFTDLELGLLQSGSNEYKRTRLDTLTSQLYFNGIKEFSITDNLKIHAIAGLGYEFLSNEQFNNKSKPFINYGAGLSYTFSNNLSLVVDGKHHLKEDNDNSLIYTIGLSIPLSSSVKSKYKPTVEKAKTLIVEIESGKMMIIYNNDKIKHTNTSNINKYIK